LKGEGAENETLFVKSEWLKLETNKRPLSWDEGLEMIILIFSLLLLV